MNVNQAEKEVIVNREQNVESITNRKRGKEDIVNRENEKNYLKSRMKRAFAKRRQRKKGMFYGKNIC